MKHSRAAELSCGAMETGAVVAALVHFSKMKSCL